MFELTGGALCLDFANTVDSRPTDEPRELLAGYDDLVEWSVQADAITPQTARRLRAKAARHPRRARAALARARTLREAIFAVFAAAVRGDAAPTAATETVNEHLSEAFANLGVARGTSGYEWRWEAEDALERVLWPVVRSAAELLTSDRLDRVRLCAADDCDWLFLDQSRNRSRRWCDMTVCGNRNKVRRFRQAQRST
jgi:predicted RNA-binding Zn ribbon-like protein